MAEYKKSSRGSKKPIRTSRVSPKMRDEGKKIASRKATSGTVSAATSKHAQKAKAAQLSRPGKVSESGTWQVAAVKLGKEIIKNVTTPKAGTPRLPAKPPAPRGKASSTPKPSTPVGPGRLGPAALKPRPTPKAKEPAKPSVSSTGKWSPGKGVQGKVSSPTAKPKKPASPGKWTSKTKGK